MLLAAALFAVVPLASAADTCFTNGQLLGVVFGSVAATLVMCTGVAVVLWMFLFKAKKEKGGPKTAYTNTVCEVDERGCSAKPSVRDQMTKIDSFKSRRNVFDVGTQKSFSTQNINEVDGNVGVQLHGEDLGGLGFNIQGNMTDGIFVKTVHPKGPAENCGNIIQGDRIKSLTIAFDNMVYEDAVTLLSYASPYKVKLELERRVESPTPGEDSPGSPKMHPLFRSNTLTNIHFNPVGCQPMRSASEATTQVHGLPEQPKEISVAPPIPEHKVESPVPEPVVEKKVEVKEEESVSEALPDSTTGADGDVSKQESSDDITSSYRESLDDVGTGTESVASTEEISQSTLPDRLEITEIIGDDMVASFSPPSPRKEVCTALPPRQPKKMSPSPRLTSKPPTPPPQPRIQEVVKKAESPVLPSTPEPSGIPVRREPSRSRITPNGRLAETLASFCVDSSTSSCDSMSSNSFSQTPPSPPRAPEITEARVSRIPKRSDSINKTPVLERKLPSIPHRSPSVEKRGEDGDVWSRLYQEKKGALRKTREPTATSSATSPRISRTPSGDRYNTLSREKRDRLEANQNTLDRQTEELRQLGIL